MMCIKRCFYQSCILFTFTVVVYRHEEGIQFNQSVQTDIDNFRV